MKRLSTFLATTLTIFGLATIAPATAQAGSSISIHTSGISVGVHDVSYRGNFRNSRRFNNRRVNRNNLSLIHI